MRDVKFTVAAKLNWQDEMAFDLNISPTDFRVGFTIGWAVNKYTGRAFISQDAIAVKLGLNVRSVRRSIERLEHLGHLRVHRRDLGTRKSDGRAVCGGRVAHRYEPVIKSRTPAPSIQGHVSDKSRTQESSFAGGERRARPTRKEDNFHTKGGLRSPPYPLNPIYYPNSGRADARASEKASELKGAQSLPSGTQFEIWVAQQIGCEHSDLIDVTTSQEIFRLRRLVLAGEGIGTEMGEIAIRIAAKRRSA